MKTSLACVLYFVLFLALSCQAGPLNASQLNNASQHEEERSTQEPVWNSTPTLLEMSSETNAIVLNHTDTFLDSTITPTESLSKIATIKEDELPPYRNHEGVTLTAAPRTAEGGEDDHYEDRDDYPPDWSIWAPSWSTPPIIEEDEEEDDEEQSKLTIEEGQDEEEGIPNVEESPRSSPRDYSWVLLYLRGKEESIKSPLKRQDFIDDLKLNLASRLSLRYEDLHLNRLDSQDGLRVNFSIISSSSPFHKEEEEHLRLLGQLVGKEVLSFSGQPFVLHRIQKSDVSPLSPMGHIHPYSHTANSPSEPVNSDEQVELMLYLTIGGLCIFLFVLALSFLALQLVKTGNGGAGGEEDENEDWKLLLTAVNATGGSSSFTAGEGCSEERSGSNCEECEIERLQATKRVGNPPPVNSQEGKATAAIANWTSKVVNSLRVSGKYIDLNH